MNNNIIKFNLIKNILGNLLSSIYILNNEIHCLIKSEYLIHFIYILKYKNELSFKQLLDIWCVDNFMIKDRFLVNYNFLDPIYNVRLRLKVKVDLIKMDLLSISNIYKSATWLEREVWDMFGIFFKGNNDLRRILTDYGFEGFPLRKDFPLVGYCEVYYSYKTKKIKYVPINLVKKMSLYKVSNPWI